MASQCDCSTFKCLPVTHLGADVEVREMGSAESSRYQFFLDYRYDANSYRLSSDVQFWTTVNGACMASPAGIANRNRFPSAVTSHPALGGSLKSATGVSA